MNHPIFRLHIPPLSLFFRTFHNDDQHLAAAAPHQSRYAPNTTFSVSFIFTDIFSYIFLITRRNDDPYTLSLIIPLLHSLRTRSLGRDKNAVSKLPHSRLASLSSPSCSYQSISMSSLFFPLSCALLSSRSPGIRVCGTAVHNVPSVSCPLRAHVSMGSDPLKVEIKVRPQYVGDPCAFFCPGLIGHSACLRKTEARNGGPSLISGDNHRRSLRHVRSSEPILRQLARASRFRCFPHRIRPPQCHQCKHSGEADHLLRPDECVCQVIRHAQDLCRRAQ
jgi:hypothetical protein